LARIRLVVFDLAGTTVHDENDVTRCLHRAAQEHGIPTTEEEIARSIGTNKIHLFQFLIARGQGQAIALHELESDALPPETRQRAEAAFRSYERHMIEHYRRAVRAMPGAEEAFHWLHERGIRVATDTGFHRNITESIMDGLGWIRRGLVDIAVHVQDVPGERGRPAPYMIFHAMQTLGIVSVHEVIKVGDQPADMLEGRNAGCAGVVGVLSGSMTAADLGRHWHTHIIPSVRELPTLMEAEFL